MAKDLVCGMEVDEDEADAQGLVSEYEDEEYFFCSPGCKQAFEQNPGAYVEGQ